MYEKQLPGTEDLRRWAVMLSWDPVSDTGWVAESRLRRGFASTEWNETMMLAHGVRSTEESLGFEWDVVTKGIWSEYTILRSELAGGGPFPH